MLCQNVRLAGVGMGPTHMRYLPIAIVLIVFALAGAFLGWRVGTKPIYRRSDDAMEEAFVGARGRSERVSRLKRRRIFVVLAYAGGGIVVAAAGMIYLAR